MTAAIPEPGDAIAPMSIAVTAYAMKVWSAVLHDANPIHLDPAAVRAMGLGDRVINQGPANLAYAYNLVAARFPGAAIVQSSARFLDNAYDGEVLRADGTVSSVVREPDGIRVGCEVNLSSEGRPVLSAVLELLFPSAG